MPPKKSIKYSTLETMGTEMKLSENDIKKIRGKKKEPIIETKEPIIESKEQSKPVRKTRKFSPPKTEPKSGRLIKGSEEARKRMSELRAMRGKKKQSSQQ